MAIPTLFFGLISLGILGKLESDLREATQQPDLLLGDYFDFLCGTSTGDIIADYLSSGMSVSQVLDLCEQWHQHVSTGEVVFATSRKIRVRTIGWLTKKTLNSQLNGPDYVYHESDPAVELGDPRLKDLLMLMMRNHTTGSPWPDCNLHLPLWQLVRASTAAPTFFPPEVVTFAEGTEHEYRYIFVDGGMTTYNNPAYMAFKMATAQPYHINWQAGVDQLLIVSVGTGNAPAQRMSLEAGDLNLLDHAKNIPSALMNAATAGWDMVCRMMGECRFGDPIDGEYGDMLLPPGGSARASNWTGSKQFAYVRYDPLTTQSQLDDLGLSEISSAAMQQMDNVSLIPDLYRVGKAYAKRYLQLDHLTGFVPGPST